MSDRTATTKVEPHGDGSLTITVHVEAEDAENIVEAARARGVSVPEWVYHCLVIGVQSREIAREVLAQEATGETKALTTPCEKNCPDPADHKVLAVEIGVIERMLQDRPESEEAILSGGVAHLMSRGLPEAQAKTVVDHIRRAGELGTGP